MCFSGDRESYLSQDKGQVLQRWAGSLPPVDSAFQHQPPCQSYSFYCSWKAFSKWQWEAGQGRTRLTIAHVTPAKQPPAEGKGFLHASVCHNAQEEQ